MRSPIILALTLLAGAACSAGTPSTSADATLERDLKLASMATLALTPPPASNFTTLETMPLHAPSPARRPQAAQGGSRLVSSPRPTASAAVTEQRQDAGEAAEASV
ncbi:MAG: hypothetical protein H0X64_14900, partial [Gemmatimonadaceae bacterium]|nr:hypothetical protein [Gemmatimonadaceae bacterium]